MNRLKLYAAVIFSLCLFIDAAYPQSRAVLTNQNKATITTNGRGAVTGSILDIMIQNIINGTANQNDTNIFTGSNSFLGPFSLSTPLAVASGGTGANTLSGVRSAIGAAASGANSDITSILGLTTPLSVSQGGTGGNSLAGLLPHAATTAILQNIPVTIGTTYIRDGQFAAGDGGQAVYIGSTAACTLHSGLGDNGAQIAAPGGCWNLQAQFQADVRIWPVTNNNACTSTGAPPVPVTLLSGIDDGPALRDALAWATTNGTKVVFPGNAVYSICSQDLSQAPGGLVAGPAVATTTTTGQSAGDLSVTVGSLTGITVGTNIGILDTRGTVEGKAVSAISGNTLTISALAAAVSSGASIWVYNTTVPSKSWALEGPMPVGSSALACGFSMPYIKAGPGLNLPTLFDHIDTLSPTLTNICFGGNYTQQSGWAGGPGGKLYTVQINDGAGINENTMVLKNVAILQNYNGGLYQGFGRGHLNAYELTIQYGGQSTSDSAYALNGYDTLVKNPEIGAFLGDALVIGAGTQLVVEGGGLYTSQRGLVVNGAAVTGLYVSGTQIDDNKCGGVYINNTAASSNFSGHIFAGVKFSNNSSQGIGQCDDITVNNGSYDSFLSPAFNGGNSVAAPRYNINTGSATVNVTQPLFNTYGANGSAVTAFADNVANINCANCLDASGNPLTALTGNKALVQSAQQFSGFTLQNIAGNPVAVLQGQTSTNDGGLFGLLVAGSKKISLNAAGPSYITNSSLNVGGTTSCANSVQVCATGSDSNTTGTMNLGSPPTISGTCASGTTATGGNAAGTFSGTSACTAGTIILTFGHTAPNGWNCNTRDRTTTTDTMAETASTTTTVTLTGTTAANDVVQFQCTGY